MSRALAGAVGGLLLLAGAAAVTGSGVTLPLLDSGRATGWVERSFDGNTRYATVDLDGVAALEARATGSASGMYREDPVSLVQWPLLRWRWRVAAALRNPGERTREGDDFAARVYVVDRHPLLPWRSRALCYVWASAAAVGDTWVSPFNGNVHLIALERGDERAGAWREVRRDIAADFRRVFGDAPGSIAAVAIMTDTDQTGGVATAWYEGMRFERR